MPKNFNIYERDTFETSELSEIELGFDSDVNNLNLFAGSQDAGIKIDDFLVNYLIADLNVTARKYIPYELFVLIL